MIRAYTFFVVITALSLNGYAVEPRSVGLENMAKTLRGDVRLIVMGDSFSTPLWSRVPMASMLSWPIPKITALCGGAPQNGQFVNATAACSPVESLLWSDEENYRIFRSTEKSQFFSFPVRGIQEVYTDNSFASGADGRLFAFRFDDAEMHFGVHGPFTEDGDQIRLRMMYLASPNPYNTSVEELEVRDLNTHSAFINLHHHARGYWHLGEDPNTVTRDVIPMQINAINQDFPAVLDLDNTLRVRLLETDSLSGTNKYLHIAGGLYYHTDESEQRIPGFYFSQLSDDGWRYNGFGCDALPENMLDKKFTEEQFTHWLDVTTLDRNQPVVFYWYFSAEQLPYSLLVEKIEAMIDQANLSATKVGLIEWQHLLVLPHMYKMGAYGDSPEAHAWMLENKNALIDIATQRDNVCYASIYDATGGVVFDGTQAGNDWLEENGFTNFEYGALTMDLVHGEPLGDLLDNSDSHPSNTVAGAFYAAVLGNLIREAGCRADLVPDGVINTLDLLKIISGWEQSGESDINNDGTTDIHDLLIIIESWGECWPVQAPFNTPEIRE